jgi:hypothetical protein
MKMHLGVSVCRDPRLLDIVTIWRRMFSPILLKLILLGKSPGTCRIGSWVGPRADVDDKGTIGTRTETCRLSIPQAVSIPTALDPNLKLESVLPLLSLLGLNANVTQKYLMEWINYVVLISFVVSHCIIEPSSGKYTNHATHNPIRTDYTVYTSTAI